MAQTTTSGSYKLSAELEPPHQSDVKAVLPLPGGKLATASRDYSVGIWKRDAEDKVSSSIYIWL
jgi:hypothetical protein